MPDVPVPPQVPLTSHGAPQTADAFGFPQAEARARLLVQQLEAFDNRYEQDSYRTFVLSFLSMGLIGLAAGLYAWLGVGPTLVNWYWLPLVGGLSLLGLATRVMLSGGASQRVRIGVAVLIMGLFVTALKVNGAAPLLFLAGVVVFMHLLLRPNEALIACLLAIGAPFVIMYGSQPSDLHLIVVPRSLTAAAFALGVMQLLVRRNLAYQDVTRRAAASLEEVIQVLASDLSATRQARDLAERALTAQREADARLEAYTRLTTEALQCMSQGLAVIDPAGRFVLDNDRLRQLLDLPAELMDAQPLLSDVVAFQTSRGDFGPHHELVQGNAASYVQSLGLDPERWSRKTGHGDKWKSCSDGRG